jgi:uncharacterized protein with HEPN domain
MPIVYRDRDLLELIVELIGHIQRRLDNVQRSDFLHDADEIDLTSFRLLHIGEATHKLSSDIKSRHAHIPWIDIHGMRDIVSHDYFGVDPGIIWMTATTKLDEMLVMCRAELDTLAE